MDEKGVVKLGSIKTKPTKEKFDIWCDLRRFQLIVTEIRKQLVSYRVSKIFMESPAYGAWDISGRQAQLRGIFLYRLYLDRMFSLFPIDVAPTKLKKFVTGSGKAKKNLMGESIRRRFSNELLNVDFTNDDEIDAYCLAKFGQVSILIFNGALDVKTLPKFQQETLKGFY